MPLRIGEVAKLSRISTRTLRHYDRIGLLQPSDRGDSGYRLYSDGDLRRLQQILFYKTLNFSLPDIAVILNDPQFNFQLALIKQRQRVQEDFEQTQRVLTLIDNTLQELRETTEMAAPSFTMFENFDPSLYEEEVEERWGDTDAYAESAQRIKRYNDDDWRKIKAESKDILNAIVDLMKNEVAPNSQTAIDAVDLYRQHIDRWYYPCAPKMFAGLATMYIEDQRFKKNFDKIEEGLAQYIYDATAVTCK